MRCLAFFIFLLTGAISGPSFAQTLIQFPGSGWWLAPPPGFVFSNKPRPALRHAQAGNIQLVESKRATTTPASIGVAGTISNAGTPEETLLKSVKAVSVGGLSGVLYTLRKPRQSIEGHVLQLDGRDNTVLVSFNIPDGAPVTDMATIRQTLFSVVERPLTPDQRLAAFPVDVTERAEMRVVAVFSHAVASLTDGPGNVSDEAGEQPFATIHVVPLDPGEGFEPRRDRELGLQLAKRILKDVTFADAAIEQTARGDRLAIPYRASQPKTFREVMGMVWIWTAGRHIAVLVSQHPPDQPEQAARMMRIRNGILARPDDVGSILPPSPPIQFPGTNWSIVPPPGFALSSTPTPVIRHRNRSGILLVETPRQAINMRELGAIGTIESRGTPNETRLEAAEQVIVNGRPAVLVRLQVTRQASTTHGIMVEGQGSNVMAHFVVPNAVTDIDPAAIRAALLSVIEKPRSEQQRLGDLPFLMRELAGMRVAAIISNVVILTDGPGDQMDEHTTQPFAIVSVFQAGPGETFDPARDLPKMADRLKRDYPGTTIVSTQVVQTPQGPTAAIGYTRVIKSTGFTVGGTAWMHRSGNRLVFVIAQHSLLRPEQAARIARIRDGVLPK